MWRVGKDESTVLSTVFASPPTQLRREFTKNAIFTNIVNTSISVNKKTDLEVRCEAFNRLGQVLERIPGFMPYQVDRVLSLQAESHGWFEFKVGPDHHRINFVLLPNGYPKQVKLAMTELATYPAHLTASAYTVFIAPWFSPETVKLAAEKGYGTLDLSGNYRLHFGSIFMERVGEEPPVSVRRQAVSLFAPKSARILRALFAVPDTNWKVSELVAITEVSQGLVSRVRTELLERGWAEEHSKGIQLSAYESLLRAWADYHEETKHQAWYGYTLLHGKRLNSVLQELMSQPSTAEEIVLAGSSAAQWLAPYLRDERQYFQVTPQGFDSLYKALDLASEPTGNIVVRKTEDEGAFLDCIYVDPGYWLTSPVQTYLDLHLEGERGKEAAEHLFQNYLLPRLTGEKPMPISPISTRLSSYRGQG